MDDEIDFNSISIWVDDPENFDRAEELISLLLEFSYPPQPLRRHDQCWSMFYDQIYEGVEFQDAAWLARLFLRHGAVFQPFQWRSNRNMAKNETLLKLYLETGGSPNFRDEVGHSSLLKTLRVIVLFLFPPAMARQVLGDFNPDWETVDWYMSDNEDDLSHGDYQGCINLIVILISAGADIYEPGVSSRVRMPCTEADRFGIYDIWEEALSECGLDAEIVWQESERRAREIVRMRGATRTGVDVQVLKEQSSALRFRGNKRSDPDS